MPHAPLIERIRNFPVLTEDERARVIEEVDGRPELTSDLEAAMALAEIVDAATRPDDAIAGLADVRLGHRSTPPLASESEAAEINALLDAFEAEGESPLAEFEHLTGLKLEPLAPEASVRGDGQINGRPYAGTNGSTGTTPVLAADRPPVVHQRAHTAGPLTRRLVFAGLGLVALYGGLFSVSTLRTPEAVRVADVADVAESFRAVRGQSVSDQYAAAVDLLGEARRSTLGLFPRYDDAALNTAAAAFAAIAREVPDGHYGQEAALAIGRIRLLQGDSDAARIALESVVAHGAYRAPEAARLLDYLDAESADG